MSGFTWVGIATAAVGCVAVVGALGWLAVEMWARFSQGRGDQVGSSALQIKEGSMTTNHIPHAGAGGAG